MKSAEGAPLSELGAHPEMAGIIRQINEPSFSKKYGQPALILASAAAAIAGISLIPKPETREYSAADPQAACADIPDGVQDKDIESYSQGCLSVVQACAEQAEVLEELSAGMAEGPEGPNACTVPILRGYAQELGSKMSLTVAAMKKTNNGSEKIICNNEGRNLQDPTVARTSYEFPGRNGNR